MTLNIDIATNYDSILIYGDVANLKDVDVICCRMRMLDRYAGIS